MQTGYAETDRLITSDSSSIQGRARGRSEPLSEITGASYSQTISLPPEHVSKRWCVSFSSTLIVSMGGLIVGYGLGYSSPAYLDLTKNDSPLDQQTFPLFSSLYNLGAAIGSLLTLGTLNSVGRKFSLYLSLLLFQMGWLLIAMIPINKYSAYTLIAGRVISGIGMGICTTITPTYLAEISPPKLRGFFCSFFQLFIALGIFVVYALGVFLQYLSSFDIHIYIQNYVCLALFIALVVLSQSLLLLLIYPSPYWLLSRQLHVKAYKVFSHYWGYSDDTNMEISQVLGRVKLTGSNRVKTLLLPEVFVPCLIGCGIMFFQQFTGINALVFYESTILEFSLLKYDLSGNVAALAPSLVQVVFTIVASVFVDKLGRKKLLLLANVGMGLSIGVLGVYAIYVSEEYHFHNCTVRGNEMIDTIQCQLLGWTAIVSVCFFNACFAFGWGPVPWIVVAEITNARWKNLTMGVIVFVSWFSAFLVTLCFPYYSALVHNYGVFFSLFIFNILSIIFVLFFLPETRKKTLMEIENMFGGKRGFPIFGFK